VPATLFFSKKIISPVIRPKNPANPRTFAAKTDETGPVISPVIFPVPGLLFACFPHAIFEPFGSPKPPHRATHPSLGNA